MPVCYTYYYVLVFHWSYNTGLQNPLLLRDIMANDKR